MPASTSTSPSQRNVVLAIILASYLMIVLDISIVITGLPRIHEELGFTDAGLAWVQSAYTLVFGGFLLLAARAGDILGRRRMFILGLGLFTAASLAIVVSQSATWMLAFRAVQGLGSAILAPSTLALLQTNFPAGPERTRAVAYYGAVAGIAACLGLVVGGLFADYLSWRVGFFINLPIGATLMLLTPRVIAESERQSGRLDVAGALTSTLGMFALVYGAIRSAEASWNDSLTLGAIVAGAALLAVFLIIERSARQPIMPLRLFASRERVGAYAARVLFLGGMVGFWFFTSLFLQGVQAYSPARAGLAFLPVTVVNFAAALAVPQLTRRFGNARLLAGGLVVSVIGMAWLSLVTPDSTYWLGVALPMALIGLGQGASLSPLTAAGIAGVEPQDAGAASGLVNAAHQVGSSLGLGVLVAVSTLGAGALQGTPLLAHRIETAFAAGTAMLVLALLLVLVLVVRPAPAAAALPRHTA